MNDYLASIILGIVEGLTEFLPVSSTAHLRIVEDAMGIDLADPYWKMYTIVIQLGAILCLPVYFWKRIVGFVRTWPRGADGSCNLYTHPLSLTLIAFVATAAPVYYADKLIGENLESLAVMGWALVIGGVVMWLVDRTFRKPRIDSVERMGIVRAIYIGLAQILAAAFPGTSRSMATIAAGQTAGMSRASALEFSFFLSIPTMFAATLYKLSQVISGRDVFAAGVPMDAHRWGVLLVGCVVSFFVAWAVVAWFMHYVRRHGFTPFAIYRVLFGSFVLAGVYGLL